MSYLRSPERQRQILDCARKVFALRGYHGANVAHICAEAGIGRGTLYLYFDNKRAVLVAMLEEVLGKVRALMQRRIIPRLTREVAAALTREQVVAFCERRLGDLMAVVFGDQQTLRIVLREAVGLDVDIDKILASVDEALISIVERDLVTSRDELGLVRKDLDLRHVATLIVGGVEKLALAALRDDDNPDLAALIRSVVQFNLFGTMEGGAR